MAHDRKWEQLFGVARRSPESAIQSEHANLALAIQQVTEEVVFRLARTARLLTDSHQLVMAGGVALNSVANGKLLDQKLFDQIWIQPAAGDAGGSLGATLAGWHIAEQALRKVQSPDAMQGAYLGPSFTNRTIKNFLIQKTANYTYFENFAMLAETVATYLAHGKVIGWFQGRMEFGP